MSSHDHNAVPRRLGRLRSSTSITHHSSRSLWVILADTELEILLIREDSKKWRVGCWSPTAAAPRNVGFTVRSHHNSSFVCDDLPSWLEPIGGVRVDTRCELEQIIRETHRRATRAAEARLATS